MKYREDPDLNFLETCTSEELNIIVDVLLHDKNRQKRGIVQLPNHPLYKQHAPDHSQYWSVIAGEIQRYGSNPLAALARAGRGKHYMKILDDVCGRLDIRYIPDSSVELIERELYLTIIERALADIPPSEMKQIADSLDCPLERETPQSFMQGLTEKMRLDDRFSSYLAMIVAHGAAMHASAASYEAVAAPDIRPLLDRFAGPISAGLDKISPLSLTGSAHWIIIPTVLQVVYLRAKKNADNVD